MNMVKNTGEVVGSTSTGLGLLLLDARFFLQVIKAVSPNSRVWQGLGLGEPKGLHEAKA